jgi:hypothetical protein
MSYNPDVLLSDEFLAFSDNLKQVAGARKKLQEELKQRQEEFKQFYEATKAEIKNLDEQALSLQQQFEEGWSQKKAKKDS